MPLAKDDTAEVTPGIWRVQEHGVSSYIVKLSPGAVLVDTGPDASGRAIMMGLQSARVGLSSLRAILLTSLEPEAAGGLETLRKRSGAPAFAPGPFGSLRLARPGDTLSEHFLAVGLAGGVPEETLGYYFRPARALFRGNVLTSETAPGLDVELLLDRRRSGANR